MKRAGIIAYSYRGSDFDTVSTKLEFVMCRDQPAKAKGRSA